MLSQSAALFRQVRTFSFFTASLHVRIWSSQLCKNLGVFEHREPPCSVRSTFDRGKRSLELSCRGMNTSCGYLKESRESTREPEDALKHESRNIPNFDSSFSDEGDAEISSRRPPSKLPYFVDKFIIVRLSQHKFFDVKYTRLSNASSKTMTDP